MDDRDAELFNDSLQRCLGKADFLERFYEYFLASSPEVAARFAGTDFRRQRRMLKASLWMMTGILAGRPETTGHLDHIAALHGRARLDVRPEMYGLWLGSLLRAVREADSRYTGDVENAWRRVLAPGIKYMQSRYDAPASG
jgi:hemoglobin-like flavoprotein